MLVRLLSVSFLAAGLVFASFVAMGRATAPATIYIQTVRDAPWLVHIPEILLCGSPRCDCGGFEPPFRPDRPPSFLTPVVPATPSGWQSYVEVTAVEPTALPDLSRRVDPVPPEFEIEPHPWWAFWR